MISLSSLLKNSYVLNLETEKRVLNFNDRFGAMDIQGTMMKSKLPEEAMLEGEFARREEMIDGFLAGLSGSQIEIEQGPTAEEIIEQAKAEAEGILVKARLEAQQIADEAQKQAEILYETKKLEAQQNGLKQAESEKEKMITALEEEYCLKKEKLEQSYNEKMETMEKDIVDVIIQVFNKVFNIQFDDKKEILLYLIKNTLLDAETGKEFHIRVSQANFKFMESHIGEIKEKIGNDIQIDVIGDATLADTVCVIETESGVFNCGIDMELSNLEKDIRSLCR